MENYEIKVKHLAGYFKALGLNLKQINNKPITQDMLETSLVEMQAKCNKASDFVMCRNNNGVVSAFENFNSNPSFYPIRLAFENFEMTCYASPFTLIRTETLKPNSLKKSTFIMHGWGYFLSKQFENTNYSNKLNQFYKYFPEYEASEQDYLEQSPKQRASLSKPIYQSQEMAR